MVPQMVLLTSHWGLPCLGPESGTPTQPLPYLLFLGGGSGWGTPFVLRDLGRGRQQRGTGDRAELSWPWGHREGWVCLSPQGLPPRAVVLEGD